MRFDLLLVGALAMPVNADAPERPLDPPIVIAHRGASAYRPEHTLAAYDLAITQGADAIEPDLVPTRDGVLVARHENEIGETTNVASRPEFARRRTTKVIDGKQMEGWFTEDFTLAELKGLRARERLPQLRGSSAHYADQFAIPTLDEVIALAKRRSRQLGRPIAIYPETKHPAYFASIGLDTDARLVAALKRAGWDRADAPVFIQSFEVGNLRRLRGMTRVRLVQLLDAQGAPADEAASSYAAMATPAGLRAIARYAWGVGPNKAMLWSGEAPAPLVRDAHAAGLRVHPWTFRAENAFLPARHRSGGGVGEHGDLRGELSAALALGIDGFFTDFPDIGAQARDAQEPK